MKNNEATTDSDDKFKEIDKIRKENGEVLNSLSLVRDLLRDNNDSKFQKLDNEKLESSLKKSVNFKEKNNLISISDNRKV